MENARIIRIGIIVSSSLFLPKVIPCHLHAVKQFVESLSLSSFSPPDAQNQLILLKEGLEFLRLGWPLGTLKQS